MQELVALLQSKQLTIASVESLTAGLFSAKIAEIPGASTVLKGGLVTYMTNIKQDVLHVDADIIAKHGVISEACAQAMAQKGRAMFNSDICVSFSGNAGPSSMEDKPAGLVYMAIDYQGEMHVFHEIFKGDRNEVRTLACEYMSGQLKKLLK